MPIQLYSHTFNRASIIVNDMNSIPCKFQEEIIWQTQHINTWSIGHSYDTGTHEFKWGNHSKHIHP